MGRTVMVGWIAVLVVGCADPAPVPPDATFACEPWALGAFSGSEMRPGEPCLRCHSAEAFQATPLSAAGTVFDHPRAETYCRGVADVRITIVDADGRRVGARTGPSGNFYVRTELAPPLRAGVVTPEGVVWMREPAPHGDCNACHTATGELGALGRITP